MTLEELKAEEEKLEQAYENILEGGQEFQTRDGRVKQASLTTILQRLNAVKSQIASIQAVDGSMTQKVLLKFKGVG